MNTSNIVLNGIEYKSVNVVTAAVAVPVEPPLDWYGLPGGHTDAYDVVIEDDGRVHGYPRRHGMPATCRSPMSASLRHARTPTTRTSRSATFAPPAVNVLLPDR